MKQYAALPIAVVTITSTGQITGANPAAQQLLGFQPGTDLQDFVPADSDVQVVEHLAEPGRNNSLRLAGDGKELFVDVMTRTRADGAIDLFLTDASERVALGRQLQGLQQPGKKLLNQVHMANTTMMGYTDLVGVMLEEDEPITGERLAIVQRYLREISRAQESIDRLLKMARFGKRPDTTVVPMSRRHVVVVDDEPAITELVAELMRGLQHRVTVFEDAAAALAFCRENVEEIDLVISDFSMPALGGAALADALHAVRASLPVVLCAEEVLAIDQDRQLYQCRKPIDINDLIQMVVELI